MARYTQDSRERVRDAVDFEELVGARTELRRSGARRLSGPVPVPRGADAVVRHRPRREALPLLRLRDGRRRLLVRDGDRGARLRGRAGVAGRPLRRAARARGRGSGRARRGAPPATGCWRCWSAPPPTTCGCCGSRPRRPLARSYLAERGLEEAALREFRVGFSPGSYDRVVSASAAAGYTREELLACGLAQERRDGRGLIDRFRGRIMFPLCDERGRVLGFGARALRPDDKPKYLNSSDNAVFHKGEVLYGLDLARAPAARAGRVVLVEGYTDAVALRQAGVAEVVGSMGTALTDRQVSALARVAPTALFCQDPDAAGQEAVSRSVTALRDLNARGRGAASSSASCGCRRARIPPTSSSATAPTPCASCSSARSRSRASRSSARWSAATPQSAEGRDHVLEEAAAAIRPLPPSVLREELVQLVAGRLGLTESLVASRARRRRSAARHAPGARGSPRRAERRARRARPPRAERARLPRLLPRAARGGRGAARRGRPRRAVLRARHPPRRRVPARPPALPGGRAPGRRRAAGAVGRRARHPRGRARGHARQARARGAPARPPQPRPPHRHRPHRRPRAHPRPRRRAPAGARRDPPPAELIPSGERTSVRPMDAGWLAEQLEAGRSIESIAREAGRDPSTVAYWVNKHGLASQHAPTHAARGGIDRDELTELVGTGKSIRAIAVELGVSATTVRHWLAKFDLQTAGAGAAVRNLAPAAVVRECRHHGWTHVGAIGAWALSLQAVPDRGRERPPAARQGDPRRRGRRRMPALRLLAVRGSAAVSPRRPDREGVRAVESRAGALAGEGSGGGPEMRAPVRQLPCGSRGGGRYYWRLESPTPISRFTVVQYTGRG